MRRGIGLLLVVSGIAGLGAAGRPVAAQDPHRGHEQRPERRAAKGDDRTPLYTDLGSHHRAISTTSTRAQRYFDQGLRLTYAFNHAEAIASYKEALRYDPACAMCWAGIALALGPNINLPMDTAQGREAYAAIGRARKLAARATPAERAWIEAIATRYAADPAADRAKLDSAYADAMRRLSRRYPADQDAATLYAEAMMDLRPWDQWSPDGTPKPGTLEVVATLERVLKKNPNHPGACHYYIHAVEASPNPGRALPCAERLAQLMPGAGHLVHMPAHIYMRVGRYDLAVEHNQHAVSVDQEFIERRHPAGVYPMGYYPHNWHFLWSALTMQGRSLQAIEAARKVAENVPLETLRAVPQLEFLEPTPYYALARFGRWPEILKEPAPDSSLRYTTGIWHYARGLAFAATGKPGDAARERDSVAAIGAAIPADFVMSQNTARSLLRIAELHLSADLAARRGKPDEAVKHLLAAIEVENTLRYDEPPGWYLSMHQVLGNTLLAAGRPAAAERAFREDLRRYPENGWGLHGLARSLEAQGKGEEAAEVMQRFERAWAQADVQPVAMAK